MSVWVHAAWGGHQAVCVVGRQRFIKLRANCANLPVGDKDIRTPPTQTV